MNKPKYTKEQQALDIAALVFKGFTLAEAKALVKARYK